MKLSILNQLQEAVNTPLQLSRFENTVNIVLAFLLFRLSLVTILLPLSYCHNQTEMPNAHTIVWCSRLFPSLNEGKSLQKIWSAMSDYSYIVE